jgi:hypothetical protein
MKYVEIEAKHTRIMEKPVMSLTEILILLLFANTRLGLRIAEYLS